VIILDTTVLVYAVGDDHPLREPCARLLAAQRDGIIEMTTTVEVIQEFAHVYARSRDRTAAAQLAALYADAFPLIETNSTDLRLGLELFARHPELGAFDSVLAGVALAHEAEALVSADRAFRSVVGLRWLDPVSAAPA
jgi:predicted nucleic acid-binding protein